MQLHWDLIVFLVVVINNWVNTQFGRFTAAGPNGRHGQLPLSNANGPCQARRSLGPRRLIGQPSKAGCRIMRWFSSAS